MSTRALHEGVKIEEGPIPYSECVGRSKLSVIHDARIFLQSMVWTAMSYNPERILGLIGLGGVMLNWHQRRANHWGDIDCHLARLHRAIVLNHTQIVRFAKSKTTADNAAAAHYRCSGPTG